MCIQRVIFVLRLATFQTFDQKRCQLEKYMKNICCVHTQTNYQQSTGTWTYNDCSGFYIAPGLETLVSIQVLNSLLPVACFILTFDNELSEQVERTTTTPTALSWFSPTQRNCYNDDHTKPANVCCRGDKSTAAPLLGDKVLDQNPDFYSQVSEFQPIHFNRVRFLFLKSSHECNFGSSPIAPRDPWAVPMPEVSE